MSEKKNWEIKCPHCGDIIIGLTKFYKHCKQNNLCQCGVPLQDHKKCQNCGIMIGERHIERNEFTKYGLKICGWCYQFATFQRIN